MSKHELKYQPVAAYKVGDKILTCVSSWNGLEELRDDKGRKLIVARDPGVGAYEKLFARAFASLLPEREGTLVVLSGATDLLTELGLINKDARTNGI